ncbi:MAG TPA: HAMP domain-containing sensor histidine kinase [Anaeromyxobacteraceae bacterium]|nr:HAMP domain-containing sensor histidine kinase [Anaeromyxobacteraceae bacterium]
MLYDFVSANRDELISRTRMKLLARPWPSASTDELENGIPLFLTQLAETLRLEASLTPFSDSAIGSSASKHGRDLLAMGFTVSQVVHDYGDVCQAITELAVEKRATISSEEFHTLNRCLDTAIAAAVTEYGRLKDEATSHHEVERLGQVAHELRNLIQTALLSFQVVKAGRVGITGSTGGVLGRSLIDIRDLVDSALSEVRLAATTQRRDRVSLLVFVEEIAVAANLHAEYRDIRLTVEPVNPALAISVDPQLLASALMNLLHNAFKYTHANGQVTLRTRAENGRVFIEVEDECGGLGEKSPDLFRPFGDRRGNDRSGLGLGLSISRKAVEANGGEVRTLDLPGKGCVFGIELPLAP